MPTPEKAPTVAEEMNRFAGFTTKDGETIDPKTEDLNPVKGKNTTAEEDKVASAVAAAKPAAKAEPVALTEAEENKALDDAVKANSGENLTAEQAEKAIKAAFDKKNAPKQELTPAERAAKRSAKARVQAALRDRDRANQRADALEARLAALEKKPLTANAKSDNADDADKEPDPKDFDFGELDAKYIRALARFEARQENKTAQANQRKTEVSAADKKAADEFKAKLDAFEDKGSDVYDDFSELVIQGARDNVWPLSNVLGDLLMESDQGIAIAYELASDVDLAKEVYKKSPAQQAKWLVKRELELSAGSGEDDDKNAGKSEDDASKKVAAAKVSKAPAPVQRARGQGTNSSVPGDTTDFSAFEAAAMKRA